MWIEESFKEALKEARHHGNFQRAEELVSLVHPDLKGMKDRLTVELFTEKVGYCATPAQVTALIETQPRHLREIADDIACRFISLFGLGGSRRVGGVA